MKKNYHLKNNETVTLCPISDVHLGSQSFCREYFEYSLEILSRIKKNRRILLGGDLIEHASKTVGNSAFHTTLSLDDQIDEIINYLKPFKKDISYACIGNHEYRSSKDIDLDVTAIIARELKIPHGYQFIDNINILINYVNYK